MKFDKFWAALVHTFNVLIQQEDGSPSQAIQRPIGHPHGVNDPTTLPTAEALSPVREYADGIGYTLAGGGPIFAPPRNPQEPGETLNCKYPAMKEWESCHGPDDRKCWLRKINDHSVKIDINTNYEDENQIPVGVTRKYVLKATDFAWKPDGTLFEHGKVFNDSYPGPWIEACWGDWIEVTVHNNMRWNGTSVHWHGIRQFHTNQHDGVNGITECPIAPMDSYTYRFRAMQYGSAWYHSHYGLQYGDGLLGPLTIYGPSTANYNSDMTFRPVLMTDWNHRSVFEDWPLMLASGAAPEMTNILLNGTGQFGPGKQVPEKYQLTFKKGQKHMLILVNTAVDTTFVFSIDNHTLEVITADFVPIVPYNTTNVKVGIGQRYHVIVHGPEDPFKAERNGNFWMRTIPARKCSKFSYGPDTDMGIIRYNPNSPRTTAPLSDPWLFETNCADEPLEKLVPWQPWEVKNPANINPAWTDDDTIPWHKRYIFDVHLDMKSGGPGSGKPYIPDDKPYTRWNMHEDAMRINFSDPTILALDRTDELVKQSWLDIVTMDDMEEKWIWLVITAPAHLTPDGRKLFVPAAHPMHLHGHDFALLRQTTNSWYDDGETRGENRTLTPDKLNCDNELINCHNPTRRDVVLLPAEGYVVIAFKADNPGAWIFHCHIAFHASSGLAVQILENKHLIEQDIWRDRPEMMERCRKWDMWQKDQLHHWDWQHPAHFQDDSGV